MATGAFRAPTGQTWYGQLANAAGQLWNGSSVESPTTGNLANYKITATEAAGTGWYSFTIPTALPAGD